MTLGRALGFLKAKQDTEYSPNWHELSESEKEYLKLLRKKLEFIESLGKASNILAEIPNQPCSLEKPHLLDNEDFFLAFFLPNPPKSNCLRLSKHLNKCLSCFEIFSQVLRDYYHKHREVIKFS